MISLQIVDVIITKKKGILHKRFHKSHLPMRLSSDRIYVAMRSHEGVEDANLIE
jgi:hypothetical protein